MVLNISLNQPKKIARDWKECKKIHGPRITEEENKLKSNKETYENQEDPETKGKEGYVSWNIWLGWTKHRLNKQIFDKPWNMKKQIKLPEIHGRGPSKGRLERRLLQ